ncbi:hypothetical protein AB1395_03915 [Streptococcus pluranimalium]|uniref:hypothetical protein n=1 Tax=Streptococcus pluranimalium TaxID=82348 RepID=UPI00346507AD
MAKKKNKKDTTIDLNKIHPFTKYGVSPEHLSLLAWLNVFFVLGLTLILKEIGGYLFLTFLVASIISVVSIVVSFFKAFIKTYQIFSYILVFFDALITTLWMSFGGLALYVSDGGVTPDDFTPSRVWSYLIPVIGLFIVSIVSFTIYHQNMVVLKLNKGRAVSYPISLGAIVSSVILGRHSSSPLSDTIAAIIGAIIGAGLFPGGAVGAIFCIIDLIKHPELKEYYE